MARIHPLWNCDRHTNHLDLRTPCGLQWGKEQICVEVVADPAYPLREPDLNGEQCVPRRRPKTTKPFQTELDPVTNTSRNGEVNLCGSELAPTSASLANPPP